MITTLWILAAFIGLLAVLNRRKIFKHVFRWLTPRETTKRWNALATREDLAKLSATTADAIVDRVLARVAQEAEAHYIDALSRLRAQVVGLREQLDKLRNGWVTIGVHVRGFKVSDDDKLIYYALIQISPQRGELRAHPDSEMRQLIPYDPEMRKKMPSYRPDKKGHYFSELGAPWYGRVQGAPNSISMLGETYTNRGY